MWGRVWKMVRFTNWMCVISAMCVAVLPDAMGQGGSGGETAALSILRQLVNSRVERELNRAMETLEACGGCGARSSTRGKSNYLLRSRLCNKKSCLESVKFIHAMNKTPDYRLSSSV